MKSIVKIGFLMVLLAVALTACATAPPIPITTDPKNFKELKGKWEGSYHFTRRGELSSLTLNLYSLSPVSGRFVFYGVPYAGPMIFILYGKIEGGYIVGYWQGKPWIKLGLYKKDNGDLELKGSSFGGWDTDIWLAKIKEENIDISHLPEKIRAYNGIWKGYFSNGTPITEDIQVISEKKVVVTHAWEDNPSRPDIKAGSMYMEMTFEKDNTFYYVYRNGQRQLSYSLNKDGTLNVSLEQIGNWQIDGDLKKAE